jgi:type VI secretion system secreted protein Hcp
MSAIDSHLKLAGVTGEATQKDHKDEIELLSWSWGLTNAAYTTGGGSGKGKAQPGDFTIVKRTDKASPIIAKYCASGKHFADAVLSSAKSGDGQKDFLKVTFKEVFIVSYQVGGSSGADLTESITMSYADVEIGYKPQDDKGGLGGEVKFGWNVKTTETR